MNRSRVAQIVIALSVAGAVFALLKHHAAISTTSRHLYMEYWAVLHLCGMIDDANRTASVNRTSSDVASVWETLLNRDDYYATITRIEGPPLTVTGTALIDGWWHPVTIVIQPTISSSPSYLLTGQFHASIQGSTYRSIVAYVPSVGRAIYCHELSENDDPDKVVSHLTNQFINNSEVDFPAEFWPFYYEILADHSGISSRRER